ncbi:MAG: 4-(cytidine 5'-diphospho)-2-C-methyl-D-erythritol kinase [Erysipelotrichaceae bacterium]|nr:4-(cytidine 5'-diphospho)-2-C-methyl-D-erythritol kinase [Erysipelotrichaceae bacterium]
MIERCFAKVNLALDVFNIREDGYHDLKSVMVPISFFDELQIQISEDNNFICNKAYITNNENNSIYKMIKEFEKETNIINKYTITLNKHIPTKAGLAGGTSDAAGALRLLQKIYKMSLSNETIKKLCVAVGADVYFNYYNKPAIVSGIGDELEFFDIKDQYYILLMKPRLGVSTKQAYGILDMNICDHPDIDALVNELKNGGDILPYMQNSLEQPALLLNEDIRTVKEILKEKAGNSLMSGSGSSVFAIRKDRDILQKINNEYLDSKYFVRLTKILK